MSEPVSVQKVEVGDYVQCGLIRSGIVNRVIPGSDAFTFIDEDTRETVWRYLRDITWHRNGVQKDTPPMKEEK